MSRSTDYSMDRDPSYLGLSHNPMVMAGVNSSRLPVPTRDQREAWNVLYGRELPHHDDRLTAEQAWMINTYFDIEIHAGAHAFGGAEIGRAPTEVEYEAAAQVARGLRPWDVLFMEAPGFDNLDTQSRILSDDAKEQNGPSMTGLLGAVVRKYTDDAFDKAAQKARSTGVTVVPADIDAFESGRIIAMTGGKSIWDVAKSAPSQSKGLTADLHRLRERRARNIVKDWALDHLEEVKAVAQAGTGEFRRTRLVLLFGAHHADGLQQAFSDLGLRSALHRMDSTIGAEARVAEHLGCYVGALLFDTLGAASDYLNGVLGQTPTDNSTNSFGDSHS